MIRTPEQIERIIEQMWIALDAASDDCHIGIRADNVRIKKQFRRSYDRPDGQKTTRLPGLCVVYVGYDSLSKDGLRKAIQEAEQYGEILYLLEGESPNHLQHLANDPGERIFTSHKILWTESNCQ